MTARKECGFSQETLKLIACVSMLIDHIGAVLVPLRVLRVIGRLAFPIFCFLLAEGSVRTHNPEKYAIRLGIGVVLSELPFDLAFFHGWTWEHQNVMLTLLLGFLALESMKYFRNPMWKILAALPFAAAAQFIHTDYGGRGVLLIAMFGIVRGMKWEGVLQFLGMILICGILFGARIGPGGITIPTELFAVGAIVPIRLYNGQKRYNSKAMQWAFYLFYPAHIGILWLIKTLL